MPILGGGLSAGPGLHPPPYIPSERKCMSVYVSPNTDVFLSFRCMMQPASCSLCRLDASDGLQYPFLCCCRK